MTALSDGRAARSAVIPSAVSRSFVAIPCDEERVALRVDLNTVRRSYEELERIGAVRLERGRGSFVADPPKPMAADAQSEAAEQLARQTLAQAASMGVEPKLLIRRIAALAAKKEESR